MQQVQSLSENSDFDFDLLKASPRLIVFVGTLKLGYPLLLYKNTVPT
jgi:hypothetical protein